MPEFVNVPVPVERVLEVYALLARQTVFPTVATKEGYPEGWSQDLIYRMFIESSGAMKRILVAIAQAAPGWSTTEEVARAAGLTVRQAVASLGPFEKRVRGRYRMTRWPFAARDFVDRGIVKYSMSVQTAERILELEAQLEEHEKGQASR